MAEPPIMHPESSAVDRAGVPSDHSCRAFLDLSNDIEPYIDEMTWQLTFQRFRDIPIELRYEIYELYFDSNRERALATKNWPRYNFSAEELHRRDSAKFLPDLCIASKSCMKEAYVHLLSSLSFQFEDVLQTIQFLDEAAQSQSSELNIVHNIHSLEQRNTNECHKAHLFFRGDQCLTGLNRKAVGQSNATVNVALNMFQHLHHLRLALASTGPRELSMTNSLPPILRSVRLSPLASTSTNSTQLQLSGSRISRDLSLWAGQALGTFSPRWLPAA